MSDITVRHIDQMEGAFGGAFKRARAELGVRAFGMQVIDFPPHADRYPEHDHAGDGQEEVYLALRGSGSLQVSGEQVALTPDTMVRVGPGLRRKIVTGSDPLRLLVLGGTPGVVYEPPQISELGSPEPVPLADGADTPADG